MLAQMVQDMKAPLPCDRHSWRLDGHEGAAGQTGSQRVLRQVRHAGCQRRPPEVPGFFDNDKAYNVNVTQAMVEPRLHGRRRAEMFSYRTLPFGKKIKGPTTLRRHIAEKRAASIYRRLGEKSSRGPCTCPSELPKSNIRPPSSAAGQAIPVRGRANPRAAAGRAEVGRPHPLQGTPQAGRAPGALRPPAIRGAPPDGIPSGPGSAPAAPRSMERQILEALDAMSDSDRKA